MAKHKSLSQRYRSWRVESDSRLARWLLTRHVRKQTGLVHETFMLGDTTVRIIRKHKTLEVVAIEYWSKAADGTYPYTVLTGGKVETDA